MKKLILVRHGKSSWKENVRDHERSLKKRALKDAELVVGALKTQFTDPVVIWPSSAVRALETAKIFKEQIGVKDENFIVKSGLYTFNKSDLLRIIQTCDDGIDQLMIFGHNPAMTEIVNQLGNRNFDNIPTTGLTQILFETNSWKNLSNGKTVLYLFPKNLK